MEKAMEQLREFHRAIGDELPLALSTRVRGECQELRVRLLREEFNEYLEAEDDDDLVGIADALADIIYVAVGTAVRYGIPLDRVFDEVHRSNITKFTAGLQMRPDGKILKPDTYEPPQLKEILEDE